MAIPKIRPTLELATDPYPFIWEQSGSLGSKPELHVGQQWEVIECNVALSETPGYYDYYVKLHEVLPEPEPQEA